MLYSNQITTLPKVVFSKSVSISNLLQNILMKEILCEIQHHFILKPLQTTEWFRLSGGCTHYK